MFRNIIFGIVILIVGFIAGMLYAGKPAAGTLPESVASKGDGTTYLKGYLPPNSHITASQRFLFENRITKTTSSDDASKYLSTAINTSVESATLSLGAMCQPDKPVLKAYKGENVLITNEASTSQVILFQNDELTVPPGREGVRYQFSKLYPTNASPRGTVITSYGCAGVRGPAGFIVMFPD